MDTTALKGIEAEDTKYMVRRELRSPPSAAIAGILFSLLSTASMLLIASVDSPTDFSRDWLETWFNTTALGVGLVSFAGIAFLWFTGVIRDLVGDREDKLFSTAFLGSGIIYVVTIFVWAASFGAIFRITAQPLPPCWLTMIFSSLALPSWTRFLATMPCAWRGCIWPRSVAFGPGHVLRRAG